MIICVIKDNNGKEIGRFKPEGDKNLLDEAMESDIDIPFSCHAGACMSCAIKVIKGADLLEREKDGPQYMDTNEDTYLSCIAGVSKEKVDDDKEYILEIVI